MNEQEAIERGERIRQALPGTHVDIHWVKPAGTGEAVYTLWIWKKMLDRAIVLTSIEDVEQWIAKQKGRDKMIRGQLIIEKDGRAFVVMLGTPPLRHVIVESESTLEIHLGNAWIEGKYGLEYEKEESIKTHLFVCENSTFCRLQSGMDIRLPDVI